MEESTVPCDDIELNSEKAIELSPRQRSYRKASWQIGIFYGLAVGLALPSGIQSTFLWLLLFSVLCSLAKQFDCSSRPFIRLLTAGMIIAPSYIIVSNYRVLSIASLANYFILIMGLVAFVSGGRLPQTPAHFLQLTIQLLFKTVQNLSTYKKLSFLFCRDKKEQSFIDFPALTASLIAFAFICVIHSLLAAVNDEYAQFVNVLFDYIWELLRFLWEIDIIATVLTSLVVAYISAAIFSVEIDPQSQTPPIPTPAFRLLKIAVTPVVALLFIFSVFQARLFFFDPRLMSCRELALYVQKGFWELLAVAGLGATLWYIAHQSLIKTSEGQSRGRLLLVLYTLELLLLSVFSQHKLITQLTIFGLRDQRVLASCGVMLISITFIAFLGLLYKKISPPRVFAIQYWSLLIIALVLSYGNLDQFITKVHPLTFVHRATVYPDYAYLLTNSYDNSSSWFGIMKQAERTGIPQPKGYYWGVYKPLCQEKKYRYRHPHSGLRHHLNFLEKKYANILDKTEPRNLLRFNLREYLAYRLVRDNKQRFVEFTQFVDSECASNNRGN